MSQRDLIEIILESLPEEFNPVVASVNSRSEVISLDELESQLLTQEACNEKFKKALIADSASVNLTQNLSAASQTQPSPTQQHFSDGNSNGNSYGNTQYTTPYGNEQYGNSGGRGGYFRGRGPRGGRFRGRGGRGGGPRAYIQCQICHKTGHDASICYHRLSVPPPNVWMQGMQPASMVNNPYRAQYPSGNQRPQVPQAYLTGIDTNTTFPNVCGI